MARRRNKALQDPPTTTGEFYEHDVAPQFPVPTATMAAPTNTGERKMAGLTPEQIQSLLGSSRTKGGYVEKINQFLSGDEAGICVNDTWAELRDKKSATLKQGFENAKDHKDTNADAKFVKVLVNDEKVFLINLKAAGVAVEDEAEADADAEAVAA